MRECWLGQGGSLGGLVEGEKRLCRQSPGHRGCLLQKGASPPCSDHSGLIAICFNPWSGALGRKITAAAKPGAPLRALGGNTACRECQLFQGPVQGFANTLIQL